MNLPSMGMAYKNAFLQAPRGPEQDAAIGAVPGALRNPDGKAEAQQQSNAAMLDGRGLSRRMASGMGIAALGNPLGAPPVGGLGHCSLDLSGPAKRFKALGVDPDDYEMTLKRDEVKFKLNMEDESLKIGTDGGINYNSSKLELNVKMTTTEGSATVNGHTVHFKQTQFHLDLTMEQSRLLTGEEAENAQAMSNPLEALKNNHEAFLQKVMEKVQSLAQANPDDGGVQGSDEAVHAFGRNLGEKLYSLMEGVAEISTADAKRAVYDAFKSIRDARSSEAGLLLKSMKAATPEDEAKPKAWNTRSQPAAKATDAYNRAARLKPGMWAKPETTPETSLLQPA